MNLNATLLIQIASFLLLVWLLSKLLYRPLMDFLDKRSEGVRTMIEEAKKSQEEAKSNLKLSEDRLEIVKEEIFKLKDETRKQVDEQRREILEEAKREAKHIMARSREDIERQTKEVKEEIKKEIGRLSIDIAERIINKEIRATDHERLIEQAIKGLKESK